MSTPNQQKMDLQTPTVDATRIGDYRFEPIRGYPMLNWAGKRPFTATHYFPAQLKEQHGPIVKEWRNKLYWGDNLQVMSHLLREFRGKVKLIYIDPPFDSKADYKKTIRIKGQSINSDISVFEEKQYSDIWGTSDEYLQFIYERLILIKELLASDGSVYVHCDYQRSHYIKCIMDEIFGKNMFRNEIVWRRTTGSSSSETYNHIHDNLLFYSKTNEFTWNTLYSKYTSSYIKSNFKEDKNGRLYRETPLTAPGVRNGRSGESWRGINPGHIGKGRHWAVPTFVKKLINPMFLNDPVRALEDLHEKGRISWAKKGKGRPNLIQYIDDLEGVEIQSIWNDFTAIGGNSFESEDYPTQKPEKLLERIILASSSPSDLVLDGFMGSGTTQAVAMKLGRRFIGADINMGAMQITTKRLLKVGAQLALREKQAMNDSALAVVQTTLEIEDDVEDENAEDEIVTNAETVKYTGFEVYNVNNYDIFRNPVQAKELLVEALELNPLQAGGLFDGERDGRLWKIMPVNRIATRADLNELISRLDYRSFQGRLAEHPATPVEKVTLVCMGHEPDLAAVLRREVQASGFDIDVAVVDILREQRHLEFRHDAEARIIVRDGKLHIEQFYPLNLLNKLSLQKEAIKDWRDLVESVMIDWNYDGAIFQPALTDIPLENGVVTGAYTVPGDAGTIRIKITDLLAESLEKEIRNG